MKVPALVIALVICLGVLNAVNLTPLLGPLLYTMTPLQRYYATDYLASSWHKNDPAATTETRLLWKMKKGKSEFATEQDVVAKPVGQVIGTYSPEPFLLSDKATAEGGRLWCEDAGRRSIRPSSTHFWSRRSTTGTSSGGFSCNPFLAL